MSLKRSSDIPTGGAYFKPETVKGAVAVMFEPHSVERDVPNTYKGVTKNRDEVTCDVTVFATAADLDAGKAVEHKGIIVTHGGITNRLSRVLGDQVVGKMDKFLFDGSPAPAWIIDEIDDATFDKVAAFYEKREAAVKAALDAAPDFG